MRRLHWICVGGRRLGNNAKTHKLALITYSTILSRSKSKLSSEPFTLNKHPAHLLIFFLISISISFAFSFYWMSPWQLYITNLYTKYKSIPLPSYSSFSAQLSQQCLSPYNQARWHHKQVSPNSSHSHFTFKSPSLVEHVFKIIINNH